MDEIKDKHSNAIHPGDHVYTKIRGGRHEGEVILFIIYLQLQKKGI